MPSVTSWTRLEPRARGTDMRPSLEGRVHDPLWMLGRQWQVGEFRGEDAGSPLVARLRARVDRITAYRAGSSPEVPVRQYRGHAPLEAWVETEPPRPALDRRLAAEAGLHFLRMLAAANLDRYRQPFVAAFPFAAPSSADQHLLDTQSRRYVQVMASAATNRQGERSSSNARVPDGQVLRSELRAAVAAKQLPPALKISDRDRGTVLKVARAWLKWLDDLIATAPVEEDAWERSRMEYAFSVGVQSAGETVVLAAPEYLEGRLDWHTFVVDQQQVLPTEADGEDIVETTLPAPASYPGMPARRWWQFEDARVHFGGIEAAPEDLARMLLVEFASVYGNDWYVMPVELSVGSLCKVNSLVVLDSFGERTLVERARDVDWSMFELSVQRLHGAGGEARHDRLLLAPAVGMSLQSAPIEDVLFIRDEMANLAWAVESGVENSLGRRLDRFEAWQDVKRPVGPVAEGHHRGDDAAPPAELTYGLMSSIPDYWIPLLPEEVTPGVMRLRRGAMPRIGPDGKEVEIEPLGQILGGPELTLFEEEVPYEGAQVTRSYQYARWIDGSTHLWLGRRKRVGRSAGASGLRFDTVDRVGA